MSADIVSSASGSGGAQYAPSANSEPAVMHANPKAKVAEAPEKKELPNQKSPEQTVRETAENTREKVENATEQLNQIMETFNKGMRFRVHDDTDQTYVEIFNKNTEEVVKTFPSEDMLDLMARMENVLGMILDVEV